MLRSRALKVICHQITHVCPYKGQAFPLALCYQRAADIAHEFCYACDRVAELKDTFGLRTFRRELQLVVCKHCMESAVLHSEEPPYKGTRVTTCPGYEPVEDEGFIYVANDTACLEWMTVNIRTGERRTLADHRSDPRLRLPLAGAPGTVPSDSRDALRLEAAEKAARVRRGNRKQDEDEPTTKVTKAPRRKKTS